MSVDASTASRAARLRGSTRPVVRRAALLGGLLVVLAAGVGGVFSGGRGEVPAGTTIAGVDVGGLTSAQAQALLERRAAAVERVPVTFTAAGRRWRYAASQLGVRVDWAGAVDRAVRAGDGAWPLRGFERLRIRLLGSDVQPSVSSFPSVVAYAVRQVAQAVDRPAVEASLRRRGLTFTAVEGHPGSALERATAADAVVAALGSLHRGDPVALPVTTTQPRVRARDLADDLLRAREAVSAPITLTSGPTRWRVPRWEIARILSLPADGRTDLEIGGSAADRWLTALQQRVDRPPRDATFAVRPGGIAVAPAVPGRALDLGRTVDAVARAAFSPTSRVVQLPVVAREPARSTREARAMGITGLVGSYTTTYGGTPGRLANVDLVARLVDGALIEPGGTFSFNGTTGERNAAKGFQAAPVIINGELTDGIGGGVCQVSTTVFNAAFEAGLPILSRTNHALYISHYPLGRDATVNYPDIDLTFRNDTGRWLLLRTFVGTGSLTVNLYGAPTGRRVEAETAPLTATGTVPVERVKDPTLAKGRREVEQVGAPPRTTRVVRRVYDRSGALLHEDVFSSSYRAEPTIVRVGTKPKAKPGAGAPGPSTTPTPTTPTPTTPTPTAPTRPAPGQVVATGAVRVATGATASSAAPTRP